MTQIIDTEGAAGGWKTEIKGIVNLQSNQSTILTPAFASAVDTIYRTSMWPKDTLAVQMNTGHFGTDFDDGVGE